MADTPNNVHDAQREARENFAYAHAMAESARRAVDDAPDDDEPEIDRLVKIYGQLLHQLMAVPAPDLPCLRLKYQALLDFYRDGDICMIQNGHADAIASDLERIANGDTN
ncbi:MAG: hypothetical protein MUE77_05305 [Sandarakinorhabdus sp.]|jgi:hypothetical protein|nr:hypothetical protein [Sandarakinorhabdus sp.]